MIIVSLGQWALLFHGIVTIRSEWSDVAKTCVVQTVAPVEMQAIYMYSEFSAIVFIFILHSLGVRTKALKTYVESSNGD